MYKTSKSLWNILKIVKITLSDLSMQETMIRMNAGLNKYNVLVVQSQISTKYGLKLDDNRALSDIKFHRHIRKQKIQMNKMHYLQQLKKEEHLTCKSRQGISM